MSDGCRIVQIIPASGWVAQFEGEEDDEFFQRAVVCFALAEVTADGASATTVRPMVWGEDATEFCDEIEGFAGIVREDELESEEPD